MKKISGQFLGAHILDLGLTATGRDGPRSFCLRLDVPDGELLSTTIELSDCMEDCCETRWVSSSCADLSPFIGARILGWSMPGAGKGPRKTKEESGLGDDLVGVVVLTSRGGFTLHFHSQNNGCASWPVRPMWRRL